MLASLVEQGASNVMVIDDEVTGVWPQCPSSDHLARLAA
jgi:hypothetical protein